MIIDGTIKKITKGGWEKSVNFVFSLYIDDSGEDTSLYLSDSATMTIVGSVTRNGPRFSFEYKNQFWSRRTRFDATESLVSLIPEILAGKPE